MKKSVLLLLSAMLALSLAGCGTTDNSSVPPSSSYSSSNNSSTIGGALEDGVEDGIEGLRDGYNKLRGMAMDGTYRGAYIDPAQLEISFTLRDGKFEKIDLLVVDSKSAEHFQTLADHLIGKEIATMDDLYAPENIFDDFDETMRTQMHGGKMISAINDGLGRGVFSREEDTGMGDNSMSQSSDLSSSMESSGESSVTSSSSNA